MKDWTKKGATLASMQRGAPKAVPNVRDPVRQVNDEDDPDEDNWEGVGNSEEEEYDTPMGQRYAYRV